ncbi:2'-5' RNA ligase [Candidatus Roizmanbacteria bacterium RIFCSPLOWO2_01_FULL_38_12]|uniref:RNA 2',3'-cyclic phosphodiesterase n=1 Tax=Candidatus Roizmanbacteria bacterium RIFCSPLOWO2_01_FULL_38_12 TaxID=1802061 RepID=A0A1F7ISQ5_9BACT|nr:MAG: 2'-5' RNA ligase [Candidatus Roizmanbacteria bacterium RIFCSPHIGHO2_01_FULL_38_15]OGK35817.1 MAG: 2'-5' RNA ligase [Candidatus Roizmanbacteria bacterium RIFCSPHIGHO2_12_FULL_38_13]OGK46390.1 MAG: 2'-5' RNA ligase [Candidatus Roizmanbacteria bacterium RIFCSPLOWO2_01_FULL_38_12]
MKLFYAIDIPKSGVKHLLNDTRELREDYAHFSWIPDANLHITLHYIGERSVHKIPKIVGQTEIALFDVVPTHLYAFGLDIFINSNITIYVAFQKNRTIQTTSDRLSSIQLPQKKRSFIPHLTVARAKIPSKQQYLHLKKKLHKTDIDLDFPVTTIHLYESIARPKFPLYRKVHSFKLSR